MANSKHAHIRYNILDNCFRRKSFDFDTLHKYLNEKIAEIFPGEGVSVKTLRDDIKLFRNKKNGFGAPLPSGRKYKYENSNFSIAKRPLLENEKYLLESAQHLLDRFDSHPKYDKLSEALIRFQEEEEDNEQSSILFYDHNEEYKGIKHLKPLYHAIKNKDVLFINCKNKFTDKKFESFEFHPYVLKQYNRRWFVFGFHAENKNDKWSIPLDERLKDFETLEDKFYLHSNTNWSDFFRQMVGVTRPPNSKEVRITLRFYNKREQYFKSKPFSPDYDVDFDDKKSNEVWFYSIINRELVQQILSYGGDVEVLEPENLKNELTKHAKQLKDYYLK